MVSLKSEVILPIIVIAIRITFSGCLKEIDKGKEVACMFIIHSIVKRRIVTLYIALSNRIFALAQN